MYKVKSNYRKLYEGCLTGAIAHAIWMAGTPALRYLQYWYEGNFHIKDLSGVFGTISFGPDILFGGFFDPKCKKSPYRPEADYHLDDFINPIPENIRQLAQKTTLLYFLQEYADGKEPLLTSIIWNQNDRLFTLEKPEEFRANGGRLITNHLLGCEHSLPKWKEEYDLSEYDIGFIKKLVGQKEKPDDQVFLARKTLEPISTLQTDDFEPLTELLEYMNIYFQ